MRQYGGSNSDAELHLALVESGARPPPQRGVADPIEGEEGTFEAADFPERLGQSILLGIGREPRKARRRGAMG